MNLQIKHWDVEDEDDEIQDQDDILGLPEYVCKKRQIADALHRVSPCTVNKPAVIPKKRVFSNTSLDSIDSLDDTTLFPQKETSYSSVPVRSQTSESSDNSLALTNEERDSSTTVELAERQCIPVSPSRPNVEITTVDDDHERRRLKKKRKHRKHKHSHDESRTKHKHKHHKKHHKKHKRHRDSELDLSVSEPPTLSPQRLIEDIIEDDDDDDDNDDCKSKENDSSEVESSDVPSFLSDQQIWKWSGDSYKRPGRGGNKKTFYRSISRGDETISIGDCAVFLSSGQLDRPFIGKVDCMWETNQEKMQVKVFWFYHPEETANDFTGNLPYPGALFKSPHNDINDVQSIMNGCQVVSIEEFSSIIEKDAKRLKNIYVNNDLFYLAGDYEPVMKMINFSDGVVLTPSNT
uniref:Protein winged eye n=1 Tax=Schizaphis graminum TaxID=13262 RepID=A0A2S2NW39_SCHGA